MKHIYPDMKGFITMHKKFVMNNTNSDGALSQVLEFIREQLAELKLDAKASCRAELMCEESLVSLLKYSDFTKTQAFTVNVSKFLGSVSIKLTVPGQEFAFDGVLPLSDGANSEDISPETAEAIRNMLLRSFSQHIKYRHSGSYNIITIRAVRSSYAGLYVVLCAMLCAVICGLLMRAFVPESVYMSVNDNVFVPVRTIFLNGLKLCAIPLVFLSIVSCMADAGSMSELKHTGSRILAFFLSTQVISVSIAFALTRAFRVGDGAGLTTTVSSVNAHTESYSILSTIVNAIPSDMVRPFLDGNMLQIIVLAVILGVSAGLSGEKSVTRTFNKFSKIFTKATEIFMKMIPAVVFCSIASIILVTGISTMFSMMGTLLTILTGYALLHVLYIFMLKFIARISPAKMYRESASVIATAVSTSSSVTTLPDIIRTSKNLGVPESISSFTLPVGISLFRNSACIYFIVFTMSAAHFYGIQFTLWEMFYLGLFVMLMIFATPAVPHAGIITLSVIFSHMGCPLEYIPLCMAVDTFVDIFGTLTTCIEVTVASLVVSAREGILDMKEA